MRVLGAEAVTAAVKELCIEANRRLPRALENRIRESIFLEESELGRSVLNDLCHNLDAAAESGLPICQDTGMAVVFAEIGQEVLISGDFNEAVNEGVRQGYREGYLRCSVVEDPMVRKNTGDNTPAILHVTLVPGDRLTLTVAPKGFGSENMSRLQMFTPSASREDIIGFVAETAKLAGGNPCPPLVLGVGIGGDFELSAYLAKKALCRDLSKRNGSPYYRQLEQDMLEKVNQMGVGPQGFGGTVTALSVNIEQFPTHIAGLPVAVNVGCHVTRHQKIII